MSQTTTSSQASATPSLLQCAQYAQGCLILLDLGKAIESMVDKDSAWDWVEEFEACLVRSFFSFLFLSF